MIVGCEVDGCGNYAVTFYPDTVLCAEHDRQIGRLSLCEPSPFGRLSLSEDEHGRVSRVD